VPFISPALPLEAVIAAAVALDEALAHPHFPQARHHLRVLALRATAADCDEVARQALSLLYVLNQTIWPAKSTWEHRLEHLHRAIDHALDVSVG